MSLPTARALLALALAAGSAPVLAAGGHHAVDDAAILEEKQCEVEGWFTRARGGERLLHSGLNCRVGPVELGVAGEYGRASGAPSSTGWGGQVKWATDVREGLAVGVSLSPLWQTHVRPRYQGAILAGLLTWSASDNLAVHANLGRELVHRGDDETRYGVSGEWTAAQGWSVVLERFKEAGTHYARGGVRFAGGENWSVDLSHARRLSGPGVSAWTVGATYVFDRK